MLGKSVDLTKRTALIVMFTSLSYAVRLKWFSSIVEYTCPSLVR